MDLFETSKPEYEPLASRMRPRNLEEYIGQDHILGPGRLLRRAINRDQLSSLIFYGPPGTGKTTLARVIAGSTKSHFLSLNAVLAGVKDIRDNIEKASLWRKMDGKRTILFVDEVHRWNKSQQDALLPWVENGTFILIGATTENPYFEVNSALVSRSRVFQLLPLTEDDLSRIAWQALADPVRGYGKYRVEFETGSLEHLVEIAGGDARSLLNALELAVETSVEQFPPPEGSVLSISLEDAQESIQRRVVLYDKDGDYHFDTISAFIKSLRGSDPDAALYWLAKMVRAGEDPAFLFRRMLISACEDIGLADPQALVVVEACARAFERIGLPEGQYHLTQAALYLATAPKSNSALGYFEALKTVEKEGSTEVPPHLKDGSRDKKSFGHGENYKYPHAFRDHWIPQQYLPTGIQDTVFYNPGSLGYEGRIREEVLRKRELFWAVRPEEEEEIRTFSPEEGWKRRLGSGEAPFLEAWRNLFLEKAALVRHHRVLVAEDRRSLILTEVIRWVPEGLAAALGYGHKERDELEARLRFVPELNRPELWLEAREISPELTFERLLFWNPGETPEETLVRIRELKQHLAPGARILVFYLGPPESLLPPAPVFYQGLKGAAEALSWEELRLWEEDFLSRTRSPVWKRNQAAWEFLAQDLGTCTWDQSEGDEQAQPSARQLDQWLAEEREAGWGAYFASRLEKDRWEQLKTAVRVWWSGPPRVWKRKTAVLTIQSA